MKWIILLLIILAAFSLVAFRYRRQILAAWRFWKMYQQMKQFGKPPAREKQINKTKSRGAEAKNAELVRCARCSKWVPESSALNLRGKNFYCSKDCLNRAVKIASLVD